MSAGIKKNMRRIGAAIQCSCILKIPDPVCQNISRISRQGFVGKQGCVSDTYIVRYKIGERQWPYFNGLAGVIHTTSVGQDGEINGIRARSRIEVCGVLQAAGGVVVFEGPGPAGDDLPGAGNL